jgi:phenylalanyl-tRNA synthetase beta chain
LAHPGRSGTLQIGPQGVFGSFGELHPRVLEALDVKGPLVAFELHLDALPLPKCADPVKPQLALSTFQPVTRDFAFIVDRGGRPARWPRAAQNVDKQLVTGVQVFDLYEGKGIEPDKKSVAHRGDAAADGEDADRYRRSTPSRPRSSPK